MQNIEFRKARPRGRAFFVAALAVLMLGACSSVTDVLRERGDIADDIARSGGFTRFFVETGQFELTGYRRFSNPAVGEVSIYIEGDGIAFASRNVISPDPTPRDPVSLRLAVQDRTPNVAYLARPCQYLPPNRLQRCSPDYWTNARFAPIVISEMNLAVNAIKQAARADRIRLYGYSGGGVVAALLAAQRNDVVFLSTVASPIDHASWTRFNGFTPLRPALYPIQSARETAGVPQIHFAGTDDDVVARQFIETFVAQVVAAGGQARIVDVPGADHDCCWARRWPELSRTWLR